MCKEWTVNEVNTESKVSGHVDNPNLYSIYLLKTQTNKIKQMVTKKKRFHSQQKSEKLQIWTQTSETAATSLHGYSVHRCPQWGAVQT